MLLPASSLALLLLPGTVRALSFDIEPCVVQQLRARTVAGPELIFRPRLNLPRPAAAAAPAALTSLHCCL
jgi:hypothetical protein